MAHVNQFYNDIFKRIKLLLSARVIGYEERGIKDLLDFGPRPLEIGDAI
jgi:hypothetical protein